MLTLSRAMIPTILKGRQAFSPFRLEALVTRLRAVAGVDPCLEVRATSVYALELTGPAEEDAWPPIYRLLDAGAMQPGGGGFFVTPRKGTISPWSTKATEIFRHCGLDAVRRVERGIYFEILTAAGTVLNLEQSAAILVHLHDRMTEGVYRSLDDLFVQMDPAPVRHVALAANGRDALDRANRELGLALSDEEIGYLYASYREIGRDPTDVELVMFGQVNSEHCRHKIFNADWYIDGRPLEDSLFGMIRSTHAAHPQGTLVAYSDNAGVIEGFETDWFEPAVLESGPYRYQREMMDIVMKVETHNHPTAISPFPGAATGVGGEIRDEGATGIGGRSKAGLAAFMVSNLNVPGFRMPWEDERVDFPDRLATPLQIMIEGPIGGAAFGNEFGRPQLTGIFKTYEERYNQRHRGYHKPIMAAGGVGCIKRAHTTKRAIHDGALIVQLGGPAMRIGLGGGAASSMDTGSNEADLDFDSVQRGNPEMERRCQCVIDACMALGDANPILSIHDVGAGGLSNACPELVAGVGARFSLRRINNEERSMSPMEIWCNEAQERYMLAIGSESRTLFLELCDRERCPVAVIGEATGDGRLALHDEHFKNDPIDLDLAMILGKTPRMRRDVRRLTESHVGLDLSGVVLADAVDRVLHLPAVANKSFLITIADRSVTGLVARDQMVGPYQTPVSDVAVTASGYRSFNGEAMAMGERTNVAVIDAPTSGRMAIGEALTNIAAASIGPIGNVKLSANWMCACGEEGEDAGLFDTVQTVAKDVCPELGISIPVGKDSLSMRTVWQSPDGSEERVVAPLSLLVTAFAPVVDIRRTVTPDLKPGRSKLVLLDLGRGRNRLGGSALAQVYNQVGETPPDLDSAKDLRDCVEAVQELISQGLIQAYHDRSDGGLLVTLAEMAIAGRRGLDLDIEPLGTDDLSALFSEELGMVLQVADADLARVRTILDGHGVGVLSVTLGVSAVPRVFTIRRGADQIFSESIPALARMWSELTYRMQMLRDNPECAAEEYDNLLDQDDPGMTFGPPPGVDETVIFSPGSRPTVAILREQGVNGHIEMAAAFDAAGFESRDVHMSDLTSGRASLSEFVGLAACGGFSYGDVLGAGRGWAQSILYNELLSEMFRDFFERGETFGLGVCNGCQMLSQLKGLIPGATGWPAFVRNRSEQFEARVVKVSVLASPSIFLGPLEGYEAAMPVAHGEGRIEAAAGADVGQLMQDNLVSLRYVDHRGEPTERYPYNPNGSALGATGLCSQDGRVTILMPHPERAFRREQLSYIPPGYDRDAGPWLDMFQNARRWVG
jgi:phosphoribosylformylglycinamidine synthase